MHPLPLALLAILLLASPALPGDAPEPHFLENGVLKLGVDKSSGASVFFFGESATDRNLLNHHDRGRFVQQSFYGAKDGSKWVDKPWRWNPVQGGNWEGKPSRLEHFEAGKTSLYARTIPHHWAGADLVRTARMEEWIELKGHVAKIRFRFTYSGQTAHPATHQELPAVFMDYALPNLVFYGGAKPWTGGALTRVVPGWPNQSQTCTESWAAYLDANDWGCGVYFPQRTLLTTYRYKGDPGPTGSGCSYFAPLRTLAVEKGLQFEYVTYLTIGPAEEIRARFREIRRQEAPPAPVPAPGTPDAP